MEERMCKVWAELRGLRYGGTERGQTMAEYALILMLIVLVVIVALGVFGTALSAYYNTIVGAVSAP
jgi:Flp pilus assembly pilin Flp